STYRCLVTNTAGSATSSAATLSVTAAAGPVISGVTVTGITSSAATIIWTTNVGADSQVTYGTTSNYGTSSTLHTSFVTSHSVSLSGLSLNTLYHYRVYSRGADGLLTSSSDGTFTTLASPGSPSSYKKDLLIDPQKGLAAVFAGTGLRVSIYTLQGREI